MARINGFRDGRRLPKADVSKRIEAYNKKVEEYSAKTIEELKEMYPILGGSYREACAQAINHKVYLERIKVLEEAAKNLKKEEENDLSSGESSSNQE